MTMVSKTRNMLEDLVREGSFKWLTKRLSAFEEEIEDIERSPSAGKNWLPELSLPANVVVRRCSKALKKLGMKWVSSVAIIHKLLSFYVLWGVISLAWAIWVERIRRVFEDQEKPYEEL